MRLGRSVIAALAAWPMLICAGGCGGKPAPWTSHATLTIRNEPGATGAGAVGTYTLADSTVPAGSDGSAEIFLGGDLTPEELSITIGDRPDLGTNVSQFQAIISGYHGAGAYTLTARSGADLAIRVRRPEAYTDTWTLPDSAMAACAAHVISDAAMKDVTIREVKGSITCHRLPGQYLGKPHASAAELSGHFDVFAEVWCGPGNPEEPCRPAPSGTAEGNE
jgi:hypothetical protein